MRILCVAEKPSIARAIADIFGGGGGEQRINSFNYELTYNFPRWGGDCQVIVTAVRGHLTTTDYADQSTGSWKNTPILDLFSKPITTTIPKDMKKVESNIKTVARGIDKLLIWTDCDREGEYIGQEIVNVVKSVNARVSVERIWFNNIERTHILEAVKHPRPVDKKVVDAVEARIELDLRIGVAFTRFLTITLQNAYRDKLEKKILSFGSCQFPTLGFVVDRYRKNRSFIPEQFWYIKIQVLKDNHQPVGFRWSRNHLFDRSVVTVMLESCLSHNQATILKVEKKQTKKYRPLPLTTVELQKQGSRLLGLSSKKVLDLAEKLYQQGYISYPRTETDQFDKAMDLRKLVDKQRHDREWGGYASSLLDQGGFQTPRNGNRNDRAHPPIHPIIPAGPNIRGNEDLMKVYKFVTRRFLACCSDDAKGETTTVTLEWGCEEFLADGLVVVQENYLKVYPYDKWTSSQQEMPPFTVGDKVHVSEGNIQSGKTTAPPLLTEADLIGLMDANGIGTDATMADHIEKLIEREYIIKQQPNKQLVPTTLGMGLIEGFETMGHSALTKPIMRKNIEQSLVEITNGQKTKHQVVQFGVQQFKHIYTCANDNKTMLIQSVGQRLQGVE